MTMKAFQALPAVSGLSHRPTPARSHPRHNLNCRHPHILGAMTFLPREAPGSQWACKHLKLKPAGPPCFPPLQKPWSCRVRGDRQRSFGETSHILSFPQPVQAPSCHSNTAAEMQWLQTAWVLLGLKAEGGHYLAWEAR